MDVLIAYVVGYEHAPKIRTTIERSTTYPDAITALLALVSVPPGWRVRTLTPGYAVYLSPYDGPGYCDAYTAVEQIPAVPFP